MISNPLNFDPPLPPSSDALASKAVSAREEFNKLSHVEYATQTEEIENLSHNLDQAWKDLALFLAVNGHHREAQTIAGKVADLTLKDALMRVIEKE